MRENAEAVVSFKTKFPSFVPVTIIAVASCVVTSVVELPFGEKREVVIGALLSALARLIHRRCRQMRPAAGPACIRRVSPRAHTIPHSTAHTGTCSGAHTCARLPMSTCATSHTHTAPHTRTCACTQPDRSLHTRRRDITEKTHTCTHMEQTYAHTVAYIHTYTHEHTQTHKRTHTDTHTCNTRNYTQLPTYTHTHT